MTSECSYRYARPFEISLVSPQICIHIIALIVPTNLVLPLVTRHGFLTKTATPFAYQYLICFRNGGTQLRRYSTDNLSLQANVKLPRVILQGWVMETIITFALVFVLFGTMAEKEKAVPLAPIPDGFIVAGTTICAVRFTSSTDPVLSFGPSVVFGE